MQLVALMGLKLLVTFMGLTLMISMATALMILLLEAPVRRWGVARMRESPIFCMVQRLV